MSSKINLQTCEYARKSSIFQDNQLIYGKQYGITITSELDEGTTATITIPKMEEADETE